MAPQSPYQRFERQGSPRELPLPALHHACPGASSFCLRTASRGPRVPEMGGGLPKAGPKPCKPSARRILHPHLLCSTSFLHTPYVGLRVDLPPSHPHAPQARLATSQRDRSSKLDSGRTGQTRLQQEAGNRGVGNLSYASGCGVQRLAYRTQGKPGGPKGACCVRGLQGL